MSLQAEPKDNLFLATVVLKICEGLAAIVPQRL
jgi:hypothetical protein